MEAHQIIGNFGSQPLHCHEEIEIAAVYQGSGFLRNKGSRVATGPGIVSVVCPQEVHGGIPHTDTFAVRVLNVSWDWFDAAGVDWRHLYRHEPLWEDAATLATFHQVHDALLQNHSILQQEEQLLGLYAALTTAPPEDILAMRRESRPLVQAVEVLQARFAEPLTLTTLAHAVGLTPWHLCRAFRNVVGLPPHAYQNSLRVARAKALLVAGGTPADVAREVGFYDQSHLTHHVKRLLNTTPAALMPRVQ